MHPNIIQPDLILLDVDSLADTHHLLPQGDHLGKKCCQQIQQLNHLVQFLWPSLLLLDQIHVRAHVDQRKEFCGTNLMWIDTLNMMARGCRCRRRCAYAGTGKKNPTLVVAV